jgi:3D (Asp-Asp-Asp) domain-containing protein
LRIPLAPAVAVLIFLFFGTVTAFATRVVVDKGDSPSLEMRPLQVAGAETPVAPLAWARPYSAPIPTATSTNPPVPTVEAVLVEPTSAPTVTITSTVVGTFLGNFRVSFYTCAEVPNCQEGWPNATTVAADLSVLARGSCIVIEGIGQRIVGDTGGSVKGLMLDVFLPQQAGESLESVHNRALQGGVSARAVFSC